MEVSPQQEPVVTSVYKKEEKKKKKDLLNRRNVFLAGADLIKTSQKHRYVRTLG